jgi:hypothetical protein
MIVAEWTIRIAEKKKKRNGYRQIERGTRNGNSGSRSGGQGHDAEEKSFNCLQSALVI